MEDGFVAYERTTSSEKIIVAANRSGSIVTLPQNKPSVDLLTDEMFDGNVIVRPDTVRILKIQKKGDSRNGKAV